MKLSKLLPAVVAAVTLTAVPAVVQSQTLASADTDPGMIVLDALLPSEQLTYDADGNAHYYEGDVAVTGKFSLKPNFTLGDVNENGSVDAGDAFSILTLAADLGADDVDAAARLTVYADVNEDGAVNSSDAADVLAYSAKGGAEGSLKPFGYTLYYANAQGVLQSGKIEDETTGDTYFADDDFRLLTGWVQDDTGYRYFLDDDGVMLFNTWAKLPNGEYCWLDYDGSVLKNAWLDTTAGYIYFNEKGEHVTGEQTIGGRTYMFDENGIRVEGLTESEDGGTVLADESTGEILTGWQTVDGRECYFDPSTGTMIRNCWLEIGDKEYFVGEDGAKATGWQTISGLVYYFGTDGVKRTGILNLDGKTYDLGEVGIRQTGWVTVDGQSCYFKPETGEMAVGLTTVDGKTYDFDAHGVKLTGWQTPADGIKRYFNADGTMQTETLKLDGMIYTFDTNGAVLSAAEAERTVSASTPAAGDIEDLINSVPRGEMKRDITVYDRQTGGGAIDFTIHLSDNDIAIIEQFAAEHFPEDSTIAEKLYITHQWIHYNVDYARGDKWNAIVDKSYVDAIFNYRMGQCVQYNGAMAAVLAYYGYDVYMVRGWTDPGCQHYWTECVLDGNTYLVETGNSGSNGDWWQYFFEEYPNPGAYQ